MPPSHPRRRTLFDDAWSACTPAWSTWCAGTARTTLATGPLTWWSGNPWCVATGANIQQVLEQITSGAWQPRLADRVMDLAPHKEALTLLAVWNVADRPPRRHRVITADTPDHPGTES